MEPTDSSACTTSPLVQMPGRVPDGNNTKTPSDEMVNWASESLADKPPRTETRVVRYCSKADIGRRLPALCIERDMGGQRKLIPIPRVHPCALRCATDCVALLTQNGQRRMLSDCPLCAPIAAVNSAYSISASARAMSFTNGCMWSASMPWTWYF